MLVNMYHIMFIFSITCFAGFRQVLPGVADMIHEVQIEGTFQDGTKLARDTHSRIEN